MQRVWKLRPAFITPRKMFGQLIAALFLLSAGSAAHAQNYTGNSAYAPDDTGTCVAVPGNGNWNDPRNWGGKCSPGTVPGNGATVTINGFGVSSDTSIATLESLTLTGGASLNVQGTMIVTNLTVNDGSVGATDFQSNQVGDWKLFQGLLGGNVTLKAGNILTISGSGGKSMNGTITNYGTIRWEGGGAIDANNKFGSYLIDNFGVFEFAADGTPFVASQALASFVNESGALVNKTAGIAPGPQIGTDATFFRGWSFTNNGEFRASVGTLDYGSDGSNNHTVFNDKSILTGAGHHRVSFGGIGTNGNVTLTNSTFDLRDARLSSGSNFIIDAQSSFNWFSGALGGLITNKGTFNIQGPDDKGWGGFNSSDTVDNFGTVNWTGTGNLSVGGHLGLLAFNNYGTFNSSNSANFVNSDSGGGTFNNIKTAASTGLFTCSGAGTTRCDWVFNNDTTSRVDSGTLNLNNGGTGVGSFTSNGTGLTRFTGGTHYLTDTAFTGTGITEIDGATLYTYGTTSIGATGAPVTLNLISGRLGGAGNTCNAIGTLNWTGGALGNQGSIFNLITGSVMNITGVVEKNCADGSTLNNSGLINWTGGDIYNANYFYAHAGPCIINNNAGATFNAASNTNFTIGDGGATFNNSGILNLGSQTLTSRWSFTQSSTGSLQTTLSSATNYGKLISHAGVTLDGKLDVKLGGTYSPVLGTSFKVIDPDARVAGAFAGLTEGKSLSIGDQIIRITYVGGDGDDVLLTAVKPTLSINSVSVLEGNLGDANKTLNFTVTLSDAFPQPVTVKYATADTNAITGKAESGKDYVATSGTLTIPANQTTGIISVPIKGDNLNEDNETFFVNLSAPTNATVANAKGVGTIIDNDALPILSSSNIIITEGTGGIKTADFTITMNAVSGRAVQFTCYTADGTARAPSDYTPTRVNLTLPAGQTSAKFSVPLVTDATDEYDETFYAFLTLPINARISTARVQATLVNDDAVALPVISIDSPLVKEGNDGLRNATYHINLSKPSGKVVSVTFTTSDRAAATGVFPATANVDYQPLTTTVKVSAGQTVAIAHVVIIGDKLDEENETFQAKISAPQNGTIAAGADTGICTILDDDTAPALSISDVQQNEGNSAQGAPGTTNYTFNVTLTAPSAKTVTVKYATADGTARSTSDYTAQSGTLTFLPGVTTMPITIKVNGDTVVEGDETFFVLLSGATNVSGISKARGVGTIINDDSSG